MVFRVAETASIKLWRLFKTGSSAAYLKALQLLALD
jgi:hypothetical protein